MKSFCLFSVLASLVLLYTTSCGVRFHVRQHETVCYLPDLKETRLTITAKPKIKKSPKGTGTDLRIEGYETPAGYKSFHVADSVNFPALDEKAEYTFEIFESCQKHHAYENGLFHNYLGSVKRGREVLYDGSLCALHHVKMKRVLMRIEAVGDTPFTIAKASAEQFPHIGVCFAFDSSAFSCKRISWECPQCIAAEAAWKSRPENRDAYPKDYYFWKANKESYSYASYR